MALVFRQAPFPFNKASYVATGKCDISRFAAAFEPDSTCHFAAHPLQGKITSCR
jgi:hypothetical protein